MVSFTRERAQKIIYGRIVPINDTNPLDLLPATLVGNGNRNPVFQQALHLAICCHEAHRRPVTDQLIDGLRDRLRWKRRIQTIKYGAETGNQDRLPFRFSSERAADPEDFFQHRDCLPAKTGK